MKVCKHCKVSLPLSDFYPIGNGKNGVRPRCKECTKKLEREKYGDDAAFRWIKLSNQAKKLREDKEFLAKHRMRMRRWHLKKAYGLSLEEFDSILESQGGGCAICSVKEIEGETKTRMVVDHCHKTNKVRGILCDLCNTAIGKMHDDVNKLKKAIEYLNGTT